MKTPSLSPSLPPPYFLLFLSLFLPARPPLPSLLSPSSFPPFPLLPLPRHQTVVKNMYLPLAERLIEKYVNENKVEAEAGKEKILRWMFAYTILSYPSSLLSFPPPPPSLLFFPSSLPFPLPLSSFFFLVSFSLLSLLPPTFSRFLPRGEAVSDGP